MQIVSYCHDSITQDHSVLLHMVSRPTTRARDQFMIKIMASKVAKPTAEQYYEAFRKSYSKLKDALPINDLLPDFFEAGVVPGNIKEKLNSIPFRSEKVLYLLDEIELGLKVGIADQFESFICVMEKFAIVNDNTVVRILAEGIRKNLGLEISQQSSSPNNFETLGEYIF